MTGMYCNKCGKMLKVQKDILYEDFIHISKTWGYFSQKDGKIQDFILCEECVETIEKDFVIPSHFEDVKEWI